MSLTSVSDEVCIHKNMIKTKVSSCEAHKLYVNTLLKK